MSKGMPNIWCKKCKEVLAAPFCRGYCLFCIAGL